jgi:hypothetical protein
MHGAPKNKVFARTAVALHFGTMKATTSPTTTTQANPTATSAPKTTLRRADERGRAEHVLLHARLTFSLDFYL